MGYPEPGRRVAEGGLLRGAGPRGRYPGGEALGARVRGGSHRLPAVRERREVQVRSPTLPGVRQRRVVPVAFAG